MPHAKFQFQCGVMEKNFYYYFPVLHIPRSFHSCDWNLAWPRLFFASLTRKTPVTISSQIKFLLCFFPD